MAKVRVKMKRSGIRALMANPALVVPRAEAIAAACNEQSSWGGYASADASSKTRGRAHVWSYAKQDGSGTTERANRLIKNLDAQ